MFPVFEHAIKVSIFLESLTWFGRVVVWPKTKSSRDMIKCMLVIYTDSHSLLGLWLSIYAWGLSF